MEDYLISEERVLEDNELGLFAVFDGHMGHQVASYLQQNLFDSILAQREFWRDTKKAVRDAYAKTDDEILKQSRRLGEGGSTAVTAILINRHKLIVANVGDSRAVLSQNGVAIQLSVDHEPSTERDRIQRRGGFVTNFPGDVPRVIGQLAVSRAFGDKSLKRFVSSEPHIATQAIESDADFLILASDGLWKVMSNQEAVDAIKGINDAHSAARRLTEAAVSKGSTDDIACIVVLFH